LILRFFQPIPSLLYWIQQLLSLKYAIITSVFIHSKNARQYLSRCSRSISPRCSPRQSCRRCKSHLSMASAELTPLQTGDAGGNTTALGIKGAVVPGTGPNSKTEVDTTVFNSVKAATNGLGKTTGGGQNTLAGMSAVIAQSGSTLPQVSSSGGTLSGTLHVVTTDGAGPFTGTLSSFTTP
jgi:hypothetical protein